MGFLHRDIAGKFIKWKHKTRFLIAVNQCHTIRFHGAAPVGTGHFSAFNLRTVSTVTTHYNMQRVKVLYKCATQNTSLD